MVEPTRKVLQPQGDDSDDFKEESIVHLVNNFTIEDQITEINRELYTF